MKLLMMSCGLKTFLKFFIVKVSVYYEFRCVLALCWHVYKTKETWVKKSESLKSCLGLLIGKIWGMTELVSEQRSIKSCFGLP